MAKYEGKTTSLKNEKKSSFPLLFRFPIPGLNIQTVKETGKGRIHSLNAHIQGEKKEEEKVECLS